MQLTLVSEKTKKLLNELGFEMSTGYGMTQEIARKWIRDIFEIDVYASIGTEGWLWSIEDIQNPIISSIDQEEECEDETAHDSYECALEKGIEKFCKLIIGFSNLSKN